MLRHVLDHAMRAIRIPRDNPDLLDAQVAAFSRQIPIVYALVVFNTLAVAVTHFGKAPHFITLYLPAVLDCVCIWRIANWWRTRNLPLTVEQAIRRLRSTVVLAVLLGSGFSAWGIGLFPYGDAYMQGQVMFFTGVTVIGCGFCLMHVRAAALLVVSLVVIPFATYLAYSGNTILIAIAINFVIVSVALVVMLLRNYADFERRVGSETMLRANQAELQAMSDINFRNSNIDSLTALPNRRHFLSDLDARIAAADNDTRLAIGILDLDGFKQINDVHGHPAGDRLLREVSNRLRAYLDPCVFVGRLGGDEFVIVSHRLRTRDAIDAACRQVAALFDAPFQFDDITVKIGCSIGFAEFPGAARTADELFERADYALFFAKKRGRGLVVGFSAEHENSIREASQIDQALVNADLERELWIAYQPIIDGDTAQPVSFESLARWNSPVLGNVPPMSFIVAAERLGMIGQLMPLLLRKVLQGAAAWPDDIRISFNLSALDIASPLSIMKIITVVQQSGIRPGRIDFEITETAVMHNMEQASSSLATLKSLGAQISLDDFGTGYSSLSCIRELPLDKVKIDRSFISKIENDSAARLILTTIIGLCSSLGLECIVEGVETREQADFLRAQGRPHMQGYYFAKPMSTQRVGDYLAASHSGALAAPVRLHHSAAPALAPAF